MYINYINRVDALTLHMLEHMLYKLDRSDPFHMLESLSLYM